MISGEDLHEAVLTMQRGSEATAHLDIRRWGVEFDTITRFAGEAQWVATSDSGSKLKVNLDAGSLAVGIAIGIIAARRDQPNPPKNAGAIRDGSRGA